MVRYDMLQLDNIALIFVQRYKTLHEPVNEKSYTLAFVKSIDPGQPVHPHSLIKMYTGYILLTQAC